MRTKRFLHLAVISTVVACMMAIGVAPAAASGDESDFVASHNSIRASQGRRTLSVQSDLTSVARRHSARMAAEGSIWHNPNLTSEVSNWQVVGENVGMGPDVDTLMNAFMNSTAHRNNILDSDYNQFGVGVVVSDGTIYVTVVFAKRSTSGSVSRPKTTTTTTTTQPRTTRTRQRSATPRAQAPAPAEPAAAAPKPAPPAPPIRTVTMLVQLNGLG